MIGMFRVAGHNRNKKDIGGDRNALTKSAWGTGFEHRRHGEKSSVVGLSRYVARIMDVSACGS